MMSMPMNGPLTGAGRISGKLSKLGITPRKLQTDQIRCSHTKTRMMTRVVVAGKED